MNYHIELVSEPNAAIREAILDGLRDYNRSVLNPGLRIEDIAVAIRDPATGGALGGLWGRTGWGWLTIEYIFVPENLRGEGIATRLIAVAEDEARVRGCHAAWLDTLNPRALGLYERLGYVRFGALQNFPMGQSRTFLQKRLGPPSSA